MAEPSPHDKLYPALSMEKQGGVEDVGNAIIVPPGPFVSPDDPGTAAGSVNLTLESSPMTISEDYAQDFKDEGAQESGGEGAHAESMEDVDVSELDNTAAPMTGQALAEASGATKSEEDGYDSWTNSDLKAEAKKRGLSNYSSYNHDMMVELLEADDRGETDKADKS